MGERTKIEWCDATWNPVTGCTPISDGCRNCWAKRMANRQRGRNGYPADDPFRVTFRPERLEQPLRWKKPRKIAVSLMGDLFHDGVEQRWLNLIFGVMSLSRRHTYLILTKRPARMAAFLNAPSCGRKIGDAQADYWNDEKYRGIVELPLPNVWLGTSVEYQQAADERIPWLLKCPAAVRWISREPSLGPVKYQLEWLQKIALIVHGGESGPGARPDHPDWARADRDQCQAAGVKFFFKQWGDWAQSMHDQEPIVRNGDIDFRSDGTVTGQVTRVDYLDNSLPPSRRNRAIGAMMRHTVKRDERVGREVTMQRVGKKAAGRLLDGREWNEMPSIGR
jgi:protein gp37